MDSVYEEVIIRDRDENLIRTCTRIRCICEHGEKLYFVINQRDERVVAARRDRDNYYVPGI